eukprot:4131562-Prymnesium_polylepis.1
MVGRSSRSACQSGGHTHRKFSSFAPSRPGLSAASPGVTAILARRSPPVPPPPSTPLRCLRSRAAVC